MYEPKFKVGDVIIPDESKVNSYEYELNDKFIRIMEVEKINNTFYYVFNGDFYKFNGFAQMPLFPAKTIDDIYILDNIYLRKDKLENIIYNSKMK
jgi:hypothetical protein